ncbi:MAG TPA: PhoH family protein [Exilispira sp.]|nr:PhoH family protein [Exilispira sp.]
MKSSKNKDNILKSSEGKIKVDSNLIPIINGINDSIIRYLEKYFDIDIYIGDDEYIIQGYPEKLSLIISIFENLVSIAKKNGHIPFDEVRLLVEQAQQNNLLTSENRIKNSIKLQRIGKKIEPKTENQIHYFESMANYDLTICYGPAGTGKTYLAVGFALQQLFLNNYKRIILTRPVVEAGEKLGFLPGDFIEKISPYLKPLYDSIFDIVGSQTYEYLIHSDIIEIIPLAYMRGRTLNDAIIILDEAQNATYSQLKMFLTRMGFHSKVIITGDITQIDLEKKSDSGLSSIIELFKSIKEISIIEFEKKDIIRHSLVRKMLNVLEEYEQRIQK